jgi:phosphoglycerate kinase
MPKLSIRDLDLKNKRVFIRVDFNVPMSGGKVDDHTRIRETLPTLRLAMEKGGRIILASHLGRPKGKVDLKYSLAPVAKVLQELLGTPLKFAADCVGPEAESQSNSLGEGEVLLLENVRFHPEEEANDPEFARQLSALCDGLFVCDAFGSAHRAHASVVGIKRLADGKGAVVPGQSHLQSRPPVCRHSRRRESLGQNRNRAESNEAGGFDADRRRHGLHVSEIAGPPNRQVAG